MDDWGYDHPDYTQDSRTWCDAEERRDRYSCRRPKGHDGPHGCPGCDDMRGLEGREPDELSMDHDYGFEDYAKTSDEWCDVKLTIDARYTSIMTADGKATFDCRRPVGHDGPHGCPGLDTHRHNLEVTASELAETYKSLGVEPPMH